MSRRARQDAALPSGHNRESLQKLIDYVEAQCRARCDEALAAAREKAASIRRRSRTRAAQLLREARAHERRTSQRRLQAERARQRSRLRDRLLADRRAAAERGIPLLVEALKALWNSGPEARSAWLARAMADAERVLLAREWNVQYPAGWDADEGAEVLGPYRETKSADEPSGISVELKPADSDGGPEAGFRVSAGRVVVDATPAGLIARRSRVAGLLLARMPEEPPEIDE